MQILEEVPNLSDEFSSGLNHVVAYIRDVSKALNLSQFVGPKFDCHAHKIDNLAFRSLW